MRILCAQVMYTVYMYKSTVTNHKYICVHMYIVDRHRKSVTRSYQAVGAVSLLLSIIGVWAMAELPELPCLRIHAFHHHFGSDENDSSAFRGYHRSPVVYGVTMWTLRICSTDGS